MATYELWLLQGKQKAKNSISRNVALVVFLSKETDEQDVACKREEKAVGIGERDNEFWKSQVGDRKSVV